MPERQIRTRRGLRSRALSSLLLWMTARTLHHDTDIAALRRRFEAADRRHVVVEGSVRRTPVDCDGVPAEWIEVPRSRPERVLLLLHGGSFAFRFPNLYAAFAARLCHRLEARTLVPDYRLAPEHPYPAPPDDCQTAWRWLQAQECDPRQTALIGDSAGGTLALVSLHRSRRAGGPLPACAVLLSPGVDCTLSSRSIVQHQHLDPVIRLANLLVMRSHYVPLATLHTDPDVSPLFADFDGFPPLLLQAGSTEMLRDEARRAAEKAHAAGVDVELELWDDTPHGFQLAPFLPESGQAIDRIVGFVQARTGWQLAAPVAPTLRTSVAQATS